MGRIPVMKILTVLAPLALLFGGWLISESRGRWWMLLPGIILLPGGLAILQAPKR